MDINPEITLNNVLYLIINPVQPGLLCYQTLKTVTPLKASHKTGQVTLTKSTDRSLPETVISPDQAFVITI